MWWWSRRVRTPCAAGAVLYSRRRRDWVGVVVAPGAGPSGVVATYSVRDGGRGAGGDTKCSIPRPCLWSSGAAWRGCVAARGQQPRAGPLVCGLQGAV